MALTVESYLWEHWRFNSEQRLKAFNFFVAFAIFVDGMAFTALDKHAHPLILLFMGGLASLLACVFAIADWRSRHLLRLSKRGLKTFEQNLPPDCRPLMLDETSRHSWVRFTVAFNMLFALQCLFGMLVTGFGIYLAWRGVLNW